MSENGIKLGQLLCDEDVITKRQLSKALQEQVKGRKGTLGEILVDMGVCTFEDITDAMMNHNSDTQKHEEKHEEIHKEPIPTPVVQPTIVEEPKVEEPVELSKRVVSDVYDTVDSAISKPTLVFELVVYFETSMVCELFLTKKPS